jgi:phosphoglycolate phosphatase
MIVIFDLDGTLIDSAYDVATSASELVTTLGAAPLELEAVINMIGEGAAVLVKRALTAAGLDPDTPGALARFLDIYNRHLLDHTQPYPGVKETLALAASRAHLAILTNKPLVPTERIVEGLGMREFFSALIGGDNPRGRKPDPAALLALVGERPTTAAVFVGDSPIDYATARAANVSFAWARYGFGSNRFESAPETPYVLERPRDLIAVLDRLDTVYSTA